MEGSWFNPGINVWAMKDALLMVALK